VHYNLQIPHYSNHVNTRLINRSWIVQDGLGISDATITRKIKAGGKLGPMESERLARIASVEAEAEKVFDSSELARRWMLEPNLALGEAPLSFLDTDTGADEVRKVLAAIAYGGVA